MKTCFKCNESKDLADFYRHPMMADGHLGKCKECAKRDVSAWYARTRVERSLYERSKRRRDDRTLTQRRGRAANPEKYHARSAVANAIRDGRLIRPSSCSACNVKCKPQGHHADYSKPLEVRWMCFKCHREIGHGQIVTASF